MTNTNQDLLTASIADQALLLDEGHLCQLLEVLISHAGGWEAFVKLYHRYMQEVCDE